MEFPEVIEPTLDKLEASYGLKNVIAGGILALSRLAADDREAIIAEANGAKKKTMPPPTVPEYVDINKAIEDLTYYVKFKLPSPEEQKKLSELRKELGPEPKKQRKKTKTS